MGPPAYLVLSWVEGQPLCAASSEPAQRAVGKVLRRVHAISREPDRDDVLFPGDTTWDAWMAGWLNAALTWWAEADPHSAQRAHEAWAWFHDLAPLLATRGHDLILFDGRAEHVLVSGDDVAGLIDVAELRTGDAAMDLAVLAVSDPGLLTAVLEGYGPSAIERETFTRLVPFYAFLRGISYAQWHQRFGTADELKRALTRLASTEIPA